MFPMKESVSESE